MAYSPASDGCGFPSLANLVSVYFKRQGFNEIILLPNSDTVSLVHPTQKVQIMDKTYSPGESTIVDYKDLIAGKILPKVL